MSPSVIARRRCLQQLVGAGIAPAWIRHATAADRPRFELGVASGSPRPDRVVLWTRVTGDDLPPAVVVDWELALDEGFRRVVARGQDTASADWAHSVHAEPTGLAPARWYWYRFSALGQHSPVGRTRTAPAADDRPDALRFTIASCQRWDHGHYAAWRQMVAQGEAQGLDLVLFLGDYIYEYAPVAGRVRRHEGEAEVRTLAQYRARYAQYKSDPALQAAHAAAPWICIWDDHEVCNDYAGDRAPGAQDDFLLRRAAAWQAYWEHLPLPPQSRPVQGVLRLYDRFDWGRLARLHAVDGRQYRDPQACPRPDGSTHRVRADECAALGDVRRSLLGPAQERWLAEGWSRQQGWNLLAQTTLMAPLSATDPALPGGGRYWTDGWDGYAPARQRLLQQMRQQQAANPVVLGGDVHCHFVADLHADPVDPGSARVATEFCGTSISSQSMPQAALDALRPWSPHLHYARSDQRGNVRFDLQADRLVAELMALDDVLRPDSGIRSAARFVVEAGRPGAQPV